MPNLNSFLLRDTRKRTRKKSIAERGSLRVEDWSKRTQVPTKTRKWDYANAVEVERSILRRGLGPLSPPLRCLLKTGKLRTLKELAGSETEGSSHAGFPRRVGD